MGSSHAVVRKLLRKSFPPVRTVPRACQGCFSTPANQPVLRREAGWLAHCSRGRRPVRGRVLGQRRSARLRPCHLPPSARHSPVRRSRRRLSPHLARSTLPGPTAHSLAFSPCEPPFHVCHR